MRALRVEETYDLRRAVLRASAPEAVVHYDTDDEPSTWHLGAVDGEGRVVATSTYFPQPCPPDVRPPDACPADVGGWADAYRLRSMAVDPGRQGSGVGRAVLLEALARLSAAGVPLLWANARDSALGFYTCCGFEAVGTSFVDADSGLPHTVVLRRVGGR